MLIIFDLDGTLTDPKEGITKCVQYALADQGIQASLEELTPFIGPPLLDSFQRFYGLDPQQAQQAVQKYRERFSKVGKYENIVYPDPGNASQTQSEWTSIGCRKFKA